MERENRFYKVLSLGLFLVLIAVSVMSFVCWDSANDKSELMSSQIKYLTSTIKDIEHQASKRNTHIDMNSEVALMLADSAGLNINDFELRKWLSGESKIDKRYKTVITKTKNGSAYAGSIEY